MKKSVFVPMVLIVVFILFVGTACSVIGGKEAETQEPNVIIITATPAAPVAPVVTEPPVVVTEAPLVPTEAPEVVTEEPPQEEENPSQGEMYFRDEFDNGLDNYDRFIFMAQEYRIYRNNEALEKKAGVELKDGKIRFNITEFWLYYYFIYQPQTYEDVKVSVEVQNLGYNASTASLICRYDEELGWYQVMIDASGQWAMYYYDAISKAFHRLTNGGAQVFNYGKDTNKYSFVCQGNELSFYINDVFSQTYEHKDLKSGKVGFEIQSPDTYTIMNVPWFEVSQP